MKAIRIGKRYVGPGYPCFIIAEMSANHGQNLNQARRLIKIAKEAGVDAIKLQTYTPDTLTIDCDNKYFRINKGTWKGETLYSLYKKAYMPWEWQKEVKKLADSLGLIFLSTPYDKSAVDFLGKLNIAAYKIASFELVDTEFITHAAAKDRPLIVSTGMATHHEVELAVRTIKKVGNRKIILLKCTSGYPARFNEMNLRGMQMLASRYGCLVGLSDHSMDPQVHIASIAAGASILEVHFMEKRSKGGPDASFSLEPHELKAMVKNVRRVETIMGNADLAPTKGENANLIFRRSLFAVKDIVRGEKFTRNNIRSIRPGYGLTPNKLTHILGKKAAFNIKRGTPMAMSYVV